MRRSLLAAVAAATAAVLVATAASQLYDTNFYLLWEATSLLAGDHPYRDFYEWGAPLAAYLSAAGQLLSGYRLIGEFVTQWLFIVAGVLVSFRLGLRLSRSTRASIAMLVLTLFVLGNTPTYHYTKLFWFPAAIWAAWAYIDRPTLRHAIVLGAVTALSFLFRHDFAIYALAGSVIAMILAWMRSPEQRTVRRVSVDVVAYGIAAVVILAPWAIVVQMNEGLVPYVQMRTVLYEEPEHGRVYTALFDTSSIRSMPAWLTAPRSPAAIAGSVLWLEQATLLVPLFLIGGAAWRARNHLSHPQAISQQAWHMALAGAFLVITDSWLIRQPSYFVLVAPTTAALATCFLAGTRSAAYRVWTTAFVAVTCAAAVVWSDGGLVFQPARIQASFSRTLPAMFASPPVARAAVPDGNPALSFRYLHDCTAPGDRLLVTGSTPYQVSYYAERPIAGGQLFWHQGWRDDPVHEQQAMTLLRRQSVPFAYSTTGPVLQEFAKYPMIREYLEDNYAPLDGSNGRVLIDKRRRAVRTFGPAAMPCFAGGGS